MSEDRPRLSQKTSLALGVVCVAGYTALGLDSLVKQADYDIVPSGEGAARVLGSTAIAGALGYGISRIPRVASWGRRVLNWMLPPHAGRRRVNCLGVVGLAGLLVGGYFSAREGDTLHPTVINGRSAVASIESTLGVHYERVGQNIDAFNHTWRGLPSAPDSDEIERTQRIQQNWSPIPHEVDAQSKRVEMGRRLQQTGGLVHLYEIAGKALTARILDFETTNPIEFSSYDLFYDGKRIGGECRLYLSLMRSHNSTGCQLWVSAPASNPFGEGYVELILSSTLNGYPSRVQTGQMSNPSDQRYTINRAYLIMDQLASNDSCLWIRSLGGHDHLFGTPLRGVGMWQIFAQDQDMLYFRDQEGQLHQRTLTGEDRRVTSNDVPEEIFRYLRGM
ncbi:MAG TPA: hypothetical protein VJH22_06370 [Candidatus Nanoarchaeia archaeon]|nr:hypothetical protein [Candidatus Nanoarchaeia archaeon]